MKKILLVLLVSILFSGCALKAYYEACKDDQACVDRANSLGSKTELVTSTALSLVPHPAAQAGAKPAGKAAGKVIFLGAMLVGGHALTKKKKVQVNG